MNGQKTSYNNLSIIFIYMFFYYFWIIYWENNEGILTLGGDILSILGSLLAYKWSLSSFKASKGTKRTFWFLLSMGVICSVIAESIWFVYDVILKVDVPLPGLPDIFYVLQLVFFLFAFIYNILKEKNKHQFIKFFLDVAIVMTVAFTFSWHFIITPMLSTDVPSLSLLISLIYPIGDLALYFGCLSIYFGVRYSFSNRAVTLIILGFTIQILADSFYLYVVSINSYNSGSLIDPLFILALLFVGLSGTFVKEMNGEDDTINAVSLQNYPFLRLFLPYINLILLLIFIMLKEGINYNFIRGLGISIFLVIIRQVLVILENQNLLSKYYKKTEELEISEQRYKSLFENNPNAVFATDLKGKFESVNKAGSKLLGYEKKDLIGKTSKNFIINKHKKIKNDHLLKVKEGTPQTYEVTISNREGNHYYVDITNIPIMIKNKMVGTFDIFRDITENRKNEEKIKYMAYHDSLTGLPNRSYFDEILTKSVAEAKEKNKMFALMYLDLDRFKIINDTLGHDVGDQLLVSVSKILRDSVGIINTVSRQGGDEFTLLIKGISSREDVEVYAENIIQAFKNPLIINGHEIVTTPSIGIAIYPRDGENTKLLMKKSDIAMYHVKKNGKGNYKIFDETHKDC